MCREIAIILPDFDLALRKICEKFSNNFAKLRQQIPVFRCKFHSLWNVINFVKQTNQPVTWCHFQDTRERGKKSAESWLLDKDPRIPGAWWWCWRCCSCSPPLKRTHHSDLANAERLQFFYTYWQFFVRRLCLVVNWAANVCFCYGNSSTIR